MATIVGGTADLALLAMLDTQPRNRGKRGARGALWCSGGREHRGSGERKRGDHGECADCVLADGVDEARPVARPTGSRTLMDLVPVFSLFHT